MLILFRGTQYTGPRKDITRNVRAKVAAPAGRQATQKDRGMDVGLSRAELAGYGGGDSGERYKKPRHDTCATTK